MKREICKLSLPLLSLRRVNTVTHIYDTWAVLSQILFAKHRKKPGYHFLVSTIFLRFLLCQTSSSNFWVDRSLQASAKTLFDIGFRPNCLTLPTSFFFDVLTQIPIILLCSGTDIRGLKIKFAYLLLERLFIMGLYELDKQSTKFTIWKHWKTLCEKFRQKRPEIFENNS